ncbi:MAG: STAS domain-containing protein [Solirubrobacteraceae bacterium]
MIRRCSVEVADRDGHAYVEVEGELDVAATPLLNQKIAEAETHDSELVVVDLTRTSFIDSTGLRALIAAQERSARDGNRFRITEGPEQLQRLFKLAGILDKLPFLRAAER